MKALNKYLWMCFTFVVNVFYNPCWAVEAKYSILSSSNLEKTSCNDSGIIQCAHNVSGAIDLIRSGYGSGVTTKHLCSEGTHYLVGCQINNKPSQLSGCLSSAVLDDITQLDCEACPEDGIVKEVAAVKSDTLELWICSNYNILSFSDGDIILGKSESSFCRDYRVSRLRLIDNGVKDCYKPASEDLDDEKGTFIYTEDCYIDTE